MNEDDVIRKASKNVLQRQSEDEKALLLLLDRLDKQEGHKTALRVCMDNNTSYVSSVELGWIVEHVGFAGDLPIFKNKVDKDSKVIEVNETTIADIPQRRPDWRRQLPMTTYLALGRHHKFPPLLIVAYQDWAYDQEANQWNSDGRAMQDSVNIKMLDTKGEYVDLDVSGTKFYALDGQHRLMAILGLHDLVKKGQLYGKGKDGKNTTSVISSENIENWYEENCDDPGDAEDSIQNYKNRLNEKIGVEILPAVMQGETYRDAHLRLRNIFVCVNENARKLQTSEVAQLDEDHGFRIVARKLMVTHELFQKTEKGKPTIRVNTERGQLAETSDHFTSLEALVSIAEGYLRQKKYKKWDRRLLDLENKDIGHVRPNDQEIKEGTEVLKKYFDNLAKLESHQDMINGTSPASLRAESGRDHILFRPIAQIALAEALGALEKDTDAKIEDLMDRLRRKEKEENGIFFKLRDPASPWFGVLCDPTKKTVRKNKSDRDLCVRMFRYFLGDDGIQSAEEREDLRQAFYDARCVAYDEATKIASVYNLEGELEHPKCVAVDPDPKEDSTKETAQKTEEDKETVYVYDRSLPLPNPWR